MLVPPEITLRSRTEFATDAEYQQWTEKLFNRLNLNDGFSYTVSLATRQIRRGAKMKLETDKISKSTQP